MLTPDELADDMVEWQYDEEDDEYDTVSDVILALNFAVTLASPLITKAFRVVL